MFTTFKIQEAGFFWKKAKKCLFGTDEQYFYLSAFLSAFSSCRNAFKDEFSAMQEFDDAYNDVQVLFDNCKFLVGLINARNFTVHRGAKFPRFVFRCRNIDLGYVFEGDGYSPEMFNSIEISDWQLYHHWSVYFDPDSLIFPDNWMELDEGQKVDYLMQAMVGAALTMDRSQIEFTLSLKLDEGSEPIEFDELDRMVTSCLDYMLSVAQRLSVKKYI